MPEGGPGFLEVALVWKLITEVIPERVGPVIFKELLLELIAFRLIPVISPARREKPVNYWKR